MTVIIRVKSLGFTEIKVSEDSVTKIDGGYPVEISNETLAYAYEEVKGKLNKGETL